MEPKFQSSFIPKGLMTSTTGGAVGQHRVGHKSFLGFLALLVFIFSVVLALGMFGYKFYLKYRIEGMEADLESARAMLERETISELIRLDDRIVSTKELVSKHHVLTPLFKFLEVSTLKTVRLTGFRFATTDQGSELSMRGEALGYTALALQADIFNKSKRFKDPAFSELNLNEKGNVTFTFKGLVDESLVSYEREVERTSALPIVPVLGSVGTTTATSSPRTATSTSN